MKKFLAVALATLTFGYAGGDITPIETPVVVEQTPVTKDFYVGINGNAVLGDRLNTLGFSVLEDDEAYGIGAQVGYTFYRSGDFETSVEGRYTYSWGSDNLGDTDIWSAFIKPSYDLDYVKAYALLGYSQVNVDSLGNDDGFTWGLGLSKEVVKNFEVFVDYTNTPEFGAGKPICDKFDTEVVTLGVNYKF